MTTKIEEFRSLFEEAILDIAAKTDPKKRCLILSGGVDTCAILAAARNVGVTFEAGFTVSCVSTSPDHEFAAAAAKEHDLEHHILHITPDELVSNHLPDCVRELNTFDGMTLRNSLVVSAVFKKASEMGFTDAVVGDAADELFGGYSIMWGNEDNPAEWKKKRDSMCRQWTFATVALAKFHNLTAHSPYMDPKVVEWALDSVERSDCIGIRPIQLYHGSEQMDHITGKILLREAYETVSSWRRKDPIEVGSGVTIIGKDEFWKSTIADDDFQAEAKALQARGFNIKTKEYLVNFRIFEECFGLNGHKLPTAKRLEIGQGCAGCCFDIGAETFCRICGTYPAQRIAA